MSLIQTWLTPSTTIGSLVNSDSNESWEVLAAEPPVTIPSSPTALIVYPISSPSSAPMTIQCQRRKSESCMTLHPRAKSATIEGRRGAADHPRLCPCSIHHWSPEVAIG